MNGPFAYSIGRTRFDNAPAQHQAATLRDFARDVLRRRARDKASAGYLCAAFGGDGRRCRENAEPSAWLAIDADSINADVWPDWRMHLTRFRGFGWTTASSTPEAPRERVIIELSEPVSRAQRMAIGELLSADVGDVFGTAVAIDASTYRPEQPCYLAPVGVRPFFLLGDALDVQRWLEQAPPPPPEAPPPTAEVVALADVRMRVVVQQLQEAGLLTKALANGRGYAMNCPWDASHTTPGAPGDTATALLFPAEANGWHGAFKCLHAHCSHRNLRHLLEVLRRARQAQERAA